MELHKALIKFYCQKCNYYYVLCLLPADHYFYELSKGLLYTCINNEACNYKVKNCTGTLIFYGIYTYSPAKRQSIRMIS